MFFLLQRSQDIKIEGLFDLCISSSNIFSYLPLSLQRARNSPNKSPFLDYSWFYRADELSNRVKSYMWQTASSMSPFCGTADLEQFYIPIQSYSEIIFNSSILSHKVTVVNKNNFNNNNNNDDDVLTDGVCH